MSQASPPAARQWRPRWLHLWLLGLVLLPCLWIWADPHTVAASEAMLATPLSHTMAAVAGPFGKLDNQLAVLLGCFLAAWVWRGRRRAWQWLAVTLLCLLATGIVVNVTKVTVRRVRPGPEPAAGALDDRPRTSFPSADVASVFAIAMATLAFAPRASLLVFVVGGMVGEARLCAGVHHFADVWGSVLISTAVSAGVVRAWRRRQGASDCDGEGEPSRASPEGAEIT